MGRCNKRQRHLEALSQVRRALSLNNEELDIFDDKPAPGNDVLEIDMESFISVIH